MSRAWQRIGCAIAIAIAASPGAASPGAASPGAASSWQDSPVVRAMKDELARSVGQLQLPGFGKPYFLSYELWDLQRVNVYASLGALVSSSALPTRTVDVDLRVGDATFDNSNVAGRPRGHGVSLPIDDDYDAIRHELWLVTDARYKTAVETLERKKAVAKDEAKSPDDVGAFSQAPPSHIDDQRPLPAFDRPALEQLARKLSAVFRKNPDVQDGTVSITGAAGHQIFVSSEGSASIQTLAFLRIEVRCSGQAADGMPVHDWRTWTVARPDQLPPEAELVAEVEKLSAEMSAVRAAPVAEDYGGPVLFEGTAGAQVVRALLAEGFSGTPAPKGTRPGAHEQGESELVGKIGKRILPRGTSMVDDPTLRASGKAPLVSAVAFDEEGVPAQKVTLVSDGTFQRFVMSRIPRKGFEHSNGHAASSPFSPVRAHPMTLIVSSSRGLSDAELRRRAMAGAREQGLKYIVVVDRLAIHMEPDELDPSMFSGDGMTLPRPVVMRRIYLDGKQELVRGASLGSVTLRDLKDLVAMGSHPTVYPYLGSGFTGRFAALMGDTSSGYLVTVIAPALLVRDIDVKKARGSQRAAPIAPRPPG